MSQSLRWRTGSGSEENECMLFRNNRCVGMVHSYELAKEIVDVMNGAAKNDREHIAKAIEIEANRIYNKQKPDYPSNTLDRVGNNIRMGRDDLLTEDPWNQDK